MAVTRTQALPSTHTEKESGEGPNLEEREKNLSEFTTDERDPDLSFAFASVHDRVIDKT